MSVLKDDIGAGIVTAMKSGNRFDAILGGAGATLYVSYQVVAFDGFDATQSWCLIVPADPMRIRRVGSTQVSRFRFLAVFHIGPGADRGLARTEISQAFAAAFGEGGDDLLDTHITDSGSNIEPGGGGEVEWTDEPISAPKERQGETEVLTYTIAVTLPHRFALA